MSWFCHWYLDSDCSRHMSRDKSVFKHFNEYRGSKVTFGDGNQSQIRGKWSVEIKGLSKLREVLYVKDLKANLLSISQICDDDCIVQFLKECNLFEENADWIMGGLRTLDNCYGIGLSSPINCNKVKLDVAELWHQRLGIWTSKTFLEPLKKNLCWISWIWEKLKKLCMVFAVGEAD